MSIIQSTWSIDNTVFRAGSVLLKLLIAAQDDDIQSSAVLALEALGSSILISPERINDGLEALECQQRSEELTLFGARIGRRPGGVSQFMLREAQRCVPSFVLASSLKAFLTDEQVSNVLYEMLVNQGLSRIPELRCSRSQLEAAVSALSGYSGPVIPDQTTNFVTSAMNQAGLDASDLKKAFQCPNAKETAKILSAVFGSIQQEDVEFVSLEGITSCAPIASCLLWLQPDQTDLIVNGRIAKRSDDCKILIQISSKVQPDSWLIKEWNEKTELSGLVVSGISSPGASFPSFALASNARTILIAQYNLSHRQGVIVGELATTLVLISLERGTVLTEFSVPATQSRKVHLKSIVQDAYLANIATCMSCYGWLESETEAAGEFATVIKTWVDMNFPDLPEECNVPPHPLTQRPMDQLLWIIWSLGKQHPRGSVGSEGWTTSLIEAAVYVAAQSIYSAICSKFVAHRYLRVGDFGTFQEAAHDILCWILLGEPLLPSCPEPIRKLAKHVIRGPTLETFRMNSMASLIPGSFSTFIGNDVATTITYDDFAFSANGHVAWMSQLRRISLDPREAVSIEVHPGFIELDSGDGLKASFSRVRAEGPESYQGVQAPRQVLNPFDSGGNYLGAHPPQGSEELSMKYFTTQTGRTILLRAYVSSTSADKNQLLQVDWRDSISAVAAATHMRPSHLPSFAEEALAKRWHEETIWSSIQAAGATTHILDTMIPFRIVGHTYRDDAIRFFFAGRTCMHRLYICHGRQSLVKCIQTGLESERLTTNQALSTYQPWMIQELAGQLTSPGWVIIPWT